jgi:2-dehydro-3-deoxyglucarate aldolase
MGNIRSNAEKYNVPCGIHIVDPYPEELKKRKDEGFRFLAYSIDAVFLSKSVKKF